MSSISNYVSNHWNGKHSLMKSFWLNMWLITFLSILSIILYHNLVLKNLSVNTSDKLAGGLELLFFLFVAFFIVSYIWGIVGTWKRASAIMLKKDHHHHIFLKKLWAFAAVLVIILTVVEIVFNAHNFIPAWVNIIDKSINHLR